MRIVTLSIFFLLQNNIMAQQLSLPQAIALAWQNSLQQKLAVADNELAILEYKSFRLQNKPTLILNGNAPVYDKDNFSVRQPDGTIRFLDRSQVNSTLNLGLQQPIAATGGILSVNTSLNRFDELIGRSKLYSGTPIYIQLQQPLFAFNNLKWQKKIEPLRLQNTLLASKETKYNIAYSVSEAYLSIASNEAEIDIAKEEQNLHHLNLEASRKKNTLGIGDKDKLLQLQMDSIQAIQTISNLNLTRSSLLKQLSLYTQTNLSTSIVKMPESLPNVAIDPAALWDSIKLHNKSINAITLAKEQLKAESEKLQKEKTQINLLLSYGLNQSGNSLKQIYSNPNDQQRFNIGFAFPIADWGRRKNIAEQINVKTTQLKIQEQILQNEMQLAIADVLEKMNQIQANFTTIKLLDSLSAIRYDMQTKLYHLGKILPIELKQSAFERINNKKNRLIATKEYILYYYKLQQLCNCNLLQY